MHILSHVFIKNEKFVSTGGERIKSNLVQQCCHQHFGGLGKKMLIILKYREPFKFISQNFVLHKPVAPQVRTFPVIGRHCSSEVKKHTGIDSSMSMSQQMSIYEGMVYVWCHCTSHRKYHKLFLGQLYLIDKGILIRMPKDSGIFQVRWYMCKIYTFQGPNVLTGILMMKPSIE